MIPYSYPWAFADLWTELQSHVGLRLLGKFVGPDPTRLREFEHLEYLALSRYPQFRFDLLASYQRLRVLELDLLPVSTLDGLDLPGLVALRLTELTKLRDISQVGRLDLRVLTIALCNKVADYQSVGSIENLERLTFEVRALDSLEFLGTLGKLRRLGLAVDHIGGDALGGLSALKSLRHLGVRRRILGRSGLARLMEALPGCVVEVW